MTDIELRVLKEANYLLGASTTIRKTALALGVSKSTVHYDLGFRLEKIDPILWKKVRLLLQNNFAEKHRRGGESTKNKYKK